MANIVIQIIFYGVRSEFGQGENDSIKLGPHRDDFSFFINKRNIKTFYSRGICRVMAYFFQLSQSYVIEESTDLPMLMLLDEPFSEVYRDLKHQLIQYIPSSFYVYVSTQQDEISNLNKDQLFGLEMEIMQDLASLLHKNYNHIFVTFVRLRLYISIGQVWLMNWIAFWFLRIFIKMSW